MRYSARVVMLVAALALAPACAPSSGHAGGTPDGAPRIRLNLTTSASPTVDVDGLPSEDLAYLARATLSHDDWTKILRVDVASGGSLSAERPAMLGTYAIRDGVLRFTPQFPLDPGQRYVVVLNRSSLPSSHRSSASSVAASLSTTVEVPAPVRVASAQVFEVYPTALEVPENQLRMYIEFSAPMEFSGGLSHIRLIDERGVVIPDPFLPLDVDLWNEDRTRFTVLYDPGRVKRGIRPNEEMGRALVAGRKYTLVVDADWRDASGQPLVAPYRRTFRVGPPQDRAIEPANWRLDVPAAGTRDPLSVSFPQPLDYGLLRRALHVVGPNSEPLEGAIQIREAETVWTFTPRLVWQPGEYRLDAASTLEDVAGNRIGRPFEVAMVGTRGADHATGASLRFRVRSSEGATAAR